MKIYYASSSRIEQGSVVVSKSKALDIVLTALGETISEYPEDARAVIDLLNSSILVSNNSNSKSVRDSFAMLLKQQEQKKKHVM